MEQSTRMRARRMTMVEINPFRGYAYNPEKVKDISIAIAPPWDVIDADGEMRLKSLSEWNAINLISAKADPAGVRDIFEDWITRKILTRDAEEHFYFSRHSFKWMDRMFTRQGIFALLRLQDFSSGNVIPHEKVFEKYHANRYKLIEKCRANFSPVFMLYKDDSRVIDGIIDGSMPEIEGVMEGEDRVAFGRIKDAATISRIKDILSPGKLIIADGHHRYQAAIRYYRDNPDAENSFVLVFLVNIESPELLILPTHRYVRSNLSFIEKKNDFEKYFDIKRMRSVEDMFSGMQCDEDARVFGVYEKGEFYTIGMKDREEVRKRMPDGFSAQWQMLDTVILHNLIFTGLLDAPSPDIFFHQSAEYLLNEYRRTESGVIFFLNPVSKKQFADICFSGELMPQKTTYFYPKVPTGLVIHKFE